MIDELQQHGEIRMRKSVEALRGEFKRLRTGRAHTGLLEHITVEYYGTRVPINQTATVAVEDARTLAVSPWEKQMVAAVERADHQFRPRVDTGHGRHGDPRAPAAHDGRAPPGPGPGRAP